MGVPLNVIDTFKVRKSSKKSLEINILENSEMRSIKRNRLLKNKVNRSI